MANMPIDKKESQILSDGSSDLNFKKRLAKGQTEPLSSMIGTKYGMVDYSYCDFERV